MNTENCKKQIAESLILANKIEGKTQINEALGRALLSNQNEFDCRNVEDPIDSDQNINYSGSLIELSLSLSREIYEMVNSLRDNLVLISDEHLHGN